MARPKQRPLRQHLSEGRLCCSLSDRAFGTSGGKIVVVRRARERQNSRNHARWAKQEGNRCRSALAWLLSFGNAIPRSSTASWIRSPSARTSLPPVAPAPCQQDPENLNQVQRYEEGIPGYDVQHRNGLAIEINGKTYGRCHCEDAQAQHVHGEICDHVETVRRIYEDVHGALVFGKGAAARPTFYRCHARRAGGPGGGSSVSGRESP
jgi:hypothetical protein